MSKFIESSVNYSECNILKLKLLKPLLIKFNEHLININKDSFKTSDIVNSDKIIIPNNNIKYYVFITNKVNINKQNQSSNYQILYFFPEKYTSITSDFYIEIEKGNNFKDNSLLEGYLYNESIFLISDILFYESKLIDCDYNFRFNLINKLFKTTSLKNINGHFNIGIHQYFNNDNYLQIFLNNFKFKQEIKSLEIYNLNSFKKEQFLFGNNKKNQEKIIEKTKYIEVYKVINIETKNEEDLLYIPKLIQAKKIEKLIKNKNSITLQCKWNENIYKWEPNMS